MGESDPRSSTLLPFPKRPQPAEELELRTDDYEALPAPVASRPPVFARGHMGAREPGAMMSTTYPAPPNSLAPMALGSERGHSTTRNRESVAPKAARPDLRTGVMIALAGAMIGGTLGVAMNNAKRNDSTARVDHGNTANAAPALPPTQAMTSLPPGMQQPNAMGMQMQGQQMPGTVPTTILPTTTVPPTAFTAVAVGPTTPPPRGGAVRGGHGGGTVKQPPPVRPQGGGGRVSVATGINDPTPPPVKPKPEPKPKSGGSTEADLLREAISEGGNSLGGTK